MYFHAITIAQSFALLSSFAFANPVDENHIGSMVEVQEASAHDLAGRRNEYRILSPGGGVFFYDSRDVFDSATLGANLVCEDFSNSGVPACGGTSSCSSICSVLEMDSTTAPNSNCLNSVQEGFILSATATTGGDRTLFVRGTGYLSRSGETTESNALGPFYPNDIIITFTTPTPTRVVSMDLYVTRFLSAIATLQLFDSEDNMLASQNVASGEGFVGIYSNIPIARVKIIGDEFEAVENLCFGDRAPSIPCGSSFLHPGSCGTPWKCCDPVVGLIGPDCCESTPFDPVVSSCCGDGTIVAGTEMNCAPSGAPSSSPSGIPSSSPSNKPSSIPSSSPSNQPSSIPSAAPSNQPSSIPSAPPSRQPSNFPSLEPTGSTCDLLGPVCDYKFKSDDTGGLIEVEETYFAVCEWHDDHYHQGCYPESLVKDVGPGQMIPGTDDRTIVTCGCCPPKEDTGIKVKDSTPVCDGALNCFGAGAVSSGAPKSGKKAKKVKFETCIDGSVFMDENFYEPDKGETVTCGDCTSNLIVL